MTIKHIEQEQTLNPTVQEQTMKYTVQEHTIKSPNIEIKKLDNTAYSGKEYSVTYTSNFIKNMDLK